MTKFQWTILLTLLLLAGGVVFRPDSHVAGMSENEFYARKLMPHPGCDVLVIGDSRVTLGVSPEAMKPSLPDRCVRNFGFLGVNLSKKYLDRAYKELPKSGKPVIVIGITPPGLRDTQGSVFTDWASKNPVVIRQYVYLGKFLAWFEPYELYLSKGPVHLRHFYADGWQATRQIPENPDERVPEFEGHYKKQKVSPEITDNLIETVSHWHDQGIAVYGVRMPVSPAMYRLEETASGFDEQSIKQRFEAVGGVWLSVPQTAYHSYDGDHLAEEGARQFSADLGRILAAELKNLPD